MKFRQLMQDMWLLGLFILTLLVAAVGFLGMLWIFAIMCCAFE